MSSEGYPTSGPGTFPGLGMRLAGGTSTVETVTHQESIPGGNEPSFPQRRLREAFVLRGPPVGDAPRFYLDNQTKILGKQDLNSGRTLPEFRLYPNPGQTKPQSWANKLLLPVWVPEGNTNYLRIWGYLGWLLAKTLTT